MAFRVPFRLGIGFRRVWAYAALATVCVWLRLPRLEGPLDLRFDAGVYYVLGTSLAEGRGYRILSEPGEIHDIQYPPLLPAIGAAHQVALGTADPDIVGHALRWTYSVLFTLYVLAVFWMGVAYLSRSGAFLAALMVAFHARTHFHAEYFVPELPYALLLTLFFGIVARNDSRSADRDRPEGSGRLSGLLAVLSFSLRTAGVTLLATWVLEALFRRQVRAGAVRAAVAVAVLAPWVGYISWVRNGPEYTQPTYAYQRAPYQFYNVSYGENFRQASILRPEAGLASATDVFARAASNLGKVAISWGESVSIGRNWWRGEFEKLERLLGRRLVPPWTAELILVSLSGLILAGLVLVGMHRGWLLVCSVTMSVALFLVTPAEDSMLRYLSSMTSVSAVALLYLLEWVRGRLRLRTGRARQIAGLAVAMVPLVIIAQEIHTLRKSFAMVYHPAEWVDRTGRTRTYQLLAYDRPWQLQDEAFTWLRRHAPPDAIVASSTPHWAYLKTGLKTVQPPWEPDAATAQRLLQQVPVDYLIIDNLVAYELGGTARRYSIPVVQDFPGQWELVYAVADSGSRIYHRVEKPGSRARP